MKFIDEASICVIAGDGGHGCCSFRRERCVPFGGPDGGDGGDGGSIFLQGDKRLNSLINFRYKHSFRAGRGGDGKGSQRTGKKGNDLYISVPLGTIVRLENSHELLGEMITQGQVLCVAKGGYRGIGNTHFKSSVNRSPRRFTKGEKGETRSLQLELMLLADVGLLGLPNVGKSTLTSVVSAAKTKIADYPFTTLHPQLGVVRIDSDRHFILADIPGLIKGAAKGVGLGIDFLKHLMRTKLLLHLVDISSADVEQIVTDITSIEEELNEFSNDLSMKPRWLVFNKIDRLNHDCYQSYCSAVVNRLGWRSPVFSIAALKRQGIQKLTHKIMGYLESIDL